MTIIFSFIPTTHYLFTEWVHFDSSGYWPPSRMFHKKKPFGVMFQDAFQSLINQVHLKTEHLLKMADGFLWDSPFWYAAQTNLTLPELWRQQFPLQRGSHGWRWTSHHESRGIHQSTTRWGPLFPWVQTTVVTTYPSLVEVGFGAPMKLMYHLKHLEYMHCIPEPFSLFNSLHVL